MTDNPEFGDEQAVANLLGISGTQTEQIKVVRNLIRHGDLIVDRHFVKRGRTRIFHLPTVRKTMLPEDVKNPKPVMVKKRFGATFLGGGY